MEDFIPVKPSIPGVPLIPDVRYHVEAAWSEGAVAEWRSPADGLRVRDLFDDGEGYRVALVRLDPGAEIPVHRHPAHEHIFVLAGKIRDSGAPDGAGEFGAGTYLMNPASSSHRLWSQGGCLVLIHWLGPVRFLEREDSPDARRSGRKEGP